MTRTAAGIGCDDRRDSYQAGRSAATAALAGLQGGSSSLIVAFCTGRHDAQACFNGIRAVAGETPIMGGSAIGVITSNELGHSGHQVGVAALPGDLEVKVAAEGKLDQGERATGLGLGRKLAASRSPEEKLALLFYGSTRVPPPPAPVLNVSSYLLDGLEEGLEQAPPPIVGAGLIADYDFNMGHEFCGTAVGDQHAVGAFISGDLSVQTRILHGCQPMGDYHTITRIDGPVLYEIDGRPALEVIDDILGSSDWQQRLPLLLLTLGVNHGERYGTYDEESYVNRLIVGIVPETKAIVLFEADFENGTEFQFMRRNAQLMEESATRGCAELLAQVEEQNQDPLFALYIDCAGRASAFSGAEREEASIVQQTVGAHIPLLGFYSGVEIAPLMGKSRGLDWTGVLTVLSRSRQG
jgi:hypothetical protein